MDYGWVCAGYNFRIAVTFFWREFYYMTCFVFFLAEPIKIVKRNDKRGVHCTCRPGYTKYESVGGITGCYAPSVGIARYLNGRNFSISMLGEEFISSFYNHPGIPEKQHMQCVARRSPFGRFTLFVPSLLVCFFYLLVMLKTVLVQCVLSHRRRCAHQKRFSHLFLQVFNALNVRLYIFNLYESNGTSNGSQNLAYLCHRMNLAEGFSSARSFFVISTKNFVYF